MILNFFSTPIFKFKERTFNLVFFFVEYFSRKSLIDEFKHKHKKKFKKNTDKIYIEDKFELSILLKYIAKSRYKLNLNNFEYSHITDMSFMFENMYKIKDIPFFDTSNVINMNSMFRGCNSLINVPLLDTSNVINMKSMFEHCYNLETVPLFNTSNVTDMSYLFRFCHKLDTIPLFDTSNVSDMSYMFDNCYSLTSIPLLNTSNVKRMICTFGQCSSLQNIPIFDIKHLLNDSTKQKKISGMLHRTDYNISKDNFIKLLYQNNDFVLKMLSIKNTENRQKKINNDKIKDKLLSDFDFVFRT